MSKAAYEVAGIGTVYITKKRGQKTMRLRVDTKGLVQVSVPWMIPRYMAFEFIRSKRDWIKEQQTGYAFLPYNGMLLGKTLRLLIKEGSKSTRAKQAGKQIIIPFSESYQPANPAHVLKIQKAVIKALRTEAEKVLLPRLKEFAESYGFTYKSAGIKLVTGRWGSCDSAKHISLSLYLVQLPIELIDYVLIHELTHTVHMNHSPRFWTDIEKLCPDYRQIRRKMRGLQPRIYDAKEFMS